MDTSTNEAVFAAVGIALGLILGWVLGYRSAHGEAERMRAARDKERAEAERTVADLRRELLDAHARAQEQGDALQLIPGLLSEMFHAVNRRTIAPIALNLIEQLLRPDQVAIFMTRPSQKKLVLLVGSGLPHTVSPGAQVEYGEGRIGYVAQHKVPMDEADFRTAPGVRGAEVFQVRKQLEAAGLRHLRADIAAPIVDRDTVFGVVSLGGVRAARGHEKKLLAVLAELIGVAISHSTRLRAVEESSNLDGLTGVYNRAHLELRLQEELREAERVGRPMTLVVLDLDHLEHYNLTNSNLDGDEVIKQVARLLKEAVRENDVVARMGGGEFVVLYPGAPKVTALRLAEGVRRTVESYPFNHRAHQPLGVVTVSGGVACYPDDSRTGPTLLQAASEALFEAKSDGRNRVLPASPNYLA
jgi:diguanylate cyclase (GGDEF)-like protein